MTNVLFTLLMVAAPEPMGTLDLRVEAGGLDAATVGKLAIERSFEVLASKEAVNEVKARKSNAIAALVPRVTASGSYTRLSPVDIPPIVIPEFNINITLPVFLNIYVFQFGLVLPLTDLLLLAPFRMAALDATQRAAAAKISGEEMRVSAEARVKFYEWVKNVGRRDIATQAVTLSQAHVKDANALLNVGRASRADVLALEAQVAANQLEVLRATQQLQIAEQELRLAARLKPDEPVTLGENVNTNLPAAAPRTEQLVTTAENERSELLSIKQTIASFEQNRTSARLNAVPKIEGFGDVFVINPNTRVTPLEDVFKLTWQAGVRVSWSPNDVATALTRANESDAQLASLKAQQSRLLEVVRLQVRRAALDVQGSDARIETAELGLRAAEETYRVRRSLYRSGSGTANELLDAEIRVSRARLDVLIARLDQRVSRVLMEEAVGVAQN